MLLCVRWMCEFANICSQVHPNNLKAANTDFFAIPKVVGRTRIFFLNFVLLFPRWGWGFRTAPLCGRGSWRPDDQAGLSARRKDHHWRGGLVLPRPGWWTGNQQARTHTSVEWRQVCEKRWDYVFRKGFEMWSNYLKLVLKKLLFISLDFLFFYTACAYSRQRRILNKWEKRSTKENQTKNQKHVIGTFLGVKKFTGHRFEMKIASSKSQFFLTLGKQTISSRTNKFYEGYLENKCPLSLLSLFILIFFKPNEDFSLITWKSTSYHHYS